MSTRPLAAILLAAGKGTRMRSSLPKVLHPVLGRPMLSYPLAATKDIGAHPRVVVVGYGADQVAETFTQEEGIHFALQEEQLGTGHAAAQAGPALDDFEGDVLILPGDVPLVSADIFRALLVHHRADQSVLTVLTTILDDPSSYGRIVRDKNNRLVRIVEARDASAHELSIREINSGIYMADASFLFSALSKLRNDNAQGEYYLTDIVAIAVDEGRPVGASLHPQAADLWGVNNRVELARAERRMSRRINEEWMTRGVGLAFPDTIWIEPGVVIGDDVYIEPHASLRGETRVGQRSWIGTGARLRNVILGAGVEVKPYAILEGGTIPVGRVIDEASVWRGGKRVK